MRPDLKRSVIEHLEQRRLEEAQLRELERLQAGGRSRLRIRRRRIRFAVAASLLVLLAAMLVRTASPEIAWKIADEVALNHLKQLPLEVEGTNVLALQSYFDELDFRLLQTSLDTAVHDRILGGRYCSIQGVTAAQLRLRDDAGRLKTLYQVPYDPSRFGILPDISIGEPPRITQVRGLTVELWVEKGLLFVQTRE